MSTMDSILPLLQHYWHLFNTQLLVQPHQFGLALTATVALVFVSLFWLLLLISYAFARLFGIAHDKLESKKKWEIAWCLAHVPFHSLMLVLSNTWFYLQYMNGYVF